MFFFNDTATTEIYTLSLHDALPISVVVREAHVAQLHAAPAPRQRWRSRGCHQLRPPVEYLEHARAGGHRALRSEEHTSELQSRQYLVCRLLLEKKTTLIGAAVVAGP